MPMRLSRSIARRDSRLNDGSRWRAGLRSSCGGRFVAETKSPQAGAGAISLVKRRWQPPRGNVLVLDEWVTPAVEGVRQEMSVSRDLAVNLLQTRFHQRVHEPGEKGLAWPGGPRAAGALCLGNTCGATSDSDHCMSPSNQSIGKRIRTDCCSAI